MGVRSTRENARAALSRAMREARDQVLADAVTDEDRLLAEAMTQQIDQIFKRWGWR